MESTVLDTFSTVAAVSGLPDALPPPLDPQPEDIMTLREAVKKLNEAFQDLTSLHVQTFTGEVTVNLDEGDKDTRIENLKAAIDQLRAGGDVTLVAEAFYQFDGDSYNFLTSADVPARAIELHTAAVEAGMKTRQGLMELVKDIFD